MQNFVTIVGRLVKQPEFKVAASGTSLTVMRMAQNQRKREPNGEWVDGDTWFYDVICFDKLAEKAAELPVGSPIRVSGRLQMDSWETPEGEKRSKLKIVAQDVEVSVGMVKNLEAAVGHIALSWGGNAGPAPVDNGIERSLYEEDSF